MLLLETGMLGVFVALDLFLFYVFWEADADPDVLPHRHLGRTSGASTRRSSSSSTRWPAALLMLVAILYLACAARARATGSYDASTCCSSTTCALPPTEQCWLFLAFALAFAIKVPMFPLHTWLPDAHVEAPTGGSVILAGVLLKMGTYGFLRFAFPLFPAGGARAARRSSRRSRSIGIIYGALVAMVQPDMKKLVAYSSVSHLGFVVLGICALNTQGVAGRDLPDAEPRRLDRRRCSSSSACSTTAATRG